MKKPPLRLSGMAPTNSRASSRAALVAANLVGTGLARYVLAIEPLASMEPDVVRDVVAEVVQRILTIPLGKSRAPRVRT
jgi:hypothetical protein